MSALEDWTDPLRWAEQEFGAARLGDRRRTKRLVAVAAAAAARPDGRVTAVFADDAGRQGAYGLLANAEVTAEAVLRSAAAAAVRRASGEPFAFVPVDGSSVRLADRAARKGTGPLGRHGKSGRGLQQLAALVVTADGVPQGICAQHAWARPEPDPRPRGFRRWSPAARRRWAERRRAARKRRPAARKESALWAEVLAAVAAAFRAHGDGVVPWPQLDRGADLGSLLAAAASGGTLLTVRAGQLRRRLADGRTLGEVAAEAPVLGAHTLEVPARPGRPARQARLAVRASAVRVRGGAAPLWVVVAEEVSPVGAGQAPVRWVLWTSYPVDTLAAAALVLDGDGCRWRVEDFFRALKRGGCDLERTQLRRPERVRTWAAILSSVAMRVARLKHLARTEPQQPADRDLTRDELDALILLHRPPGWRPGETPTLGQAMRWVGVLGGHSGLPSAPPAGATVLGRGLERVAIAAEVLRAQRDQLGLELVPKK